MNLNEGEDVLELRFRHPTVVFYRTWHGHLLLGPELERRKFLIPLL